MRRHDPPRVLHPSPHLGVRSVVTLPVAPMVMPKDLRGQTNGKLHPSLLDPVDGGEQLHHLAARSWAALRAGAAHDGTRVAVGADAYRPYETQVAIWQARYRRVNAWRLGARRWAGSWWVKLPGVATAAIPGTSNHGWGLAVDLDDSTTEASPAVRWMKLYAAGFGWSAELQAEPWHWRAVHGDRVPPAVVAYEASPAPVPGLPPAPPDDPTDEDDASMEILTNATTRASYLSVGSVLAPLDGERRDAYKTYGVRERFLLGTDFDAIADVAARAGLIAST